MRKLLSSPANMSLSTSDNANYQTILKFAAELSLNLMATKVSTRPDNFLGWCEELRRLCQSELNIDLLEDNQIKPLAKLQQALEYAISCQQLRMLRIAPWPIFVDFLARQNDKQAITEKQALMSYVNTLKSQSLTTLTELDLLTFVGKHTQAHVPAAYPFDVEWFGSTKGAKIFHQLLSEQTLSFEKALSFIPLEGEVTQQNYKDFVKSYKAIFTGYTLEKTTGEKAPLAAATRLLAMRRPDIFVCLTNTKIDALCQGLGLAKFNNTDFENYWQELISTIQTCPWWLSEPPILPSDSLVTTSKSMEGSEVEQLTEKEKFEQFAYQHRALLIDCFFFAGEDLPLQSNFLKLKDKQQNKNHKPKAYSGTTVKKKRTKASAKEIVEIALADPELPTYLMDKKDSLVKQVEDGKSITQAISLLRAIFG